jgi:hypothetical protein
MPRGSSKSRPAAGSTAHATATSKSRGTVLFVEAEQELRTKLERAATDVGYLALTAPTRGC